LLLEFPLHVRTPQATADDVAALLRRLPDAASLAPLLEQQDGVRRRQQRQGQHPWQRQRQQDKRQIGLEQQSSEQQGGDRACSSEDSGQPVAGPALAGSSVAIVSLPAPQEAPAVSNEAQLPGRSVHIAVLSVVV